MGVIKTVQRDSYSSGSGAKNKPPKFRDSYGGNGKTNGGKSRREKDAYASKAINAKKPLKNRRDSYSGSTEQAKSSKHKDSYSNQEKGKFTLLFWKKKNNKKFKEEDKYSTPKNPKKAKKRKPQLGLFHS